MKTLTLVSALMIMGFLACPALAEDKNITLTGVVQVVLNDEGEVTAVQVTDNAETAHNIVIDAKAREMAYEMEGAKVTITGTRQEKDDGTWVTLKTYKAVQEAVVEEVAPKADTEADW